MEIETASKLFKTPTYTRKAIDRYHEKNREQIREQQRMYKKDKYENDEQVRAQKKEYNRMYYERTKETRKQNSKKQIQQIEQKLNSILEILTKDAPQSYSL